MSLRIRPYTEGHWREVNAHDPQITEIENWPHAFDEHPDRWSEGTRKERRERSDFAGCRKCGASELSAIHLAVPS